MREIVVLGWRGRVGAATGGAPRGDMREIVVLGWRERGGAALGARGAGPRELLLGRRGPVNGASARARPGGRIGGGDVFVLGPVVARRRRGHRVGVERDHPGFGEGVVDLAPLPLQPV